MWTDRVSSDSDMDAAASWRRKWLYRYVEVHAARKRGERVRLERGELGSLCRVLCELGLLDGQNTSSRTVQAVLGGSRRDVTACLRETRQSLLNDFARVGFVCTDYSGLIEVMREAGDEDEHMPCALLDHVRTYQGDPPGGDNSPYPSTRDAE